MKTLTKFLSLLLICFPLVLAGCGDDSEPVNEGDGSDTMGAQSLEQAKKTLQEVAQSGTGGSGLAGVEEQLKSAGKENLLPTFQKLQAADNAGNTAQVKKLASELASKL